MVVAFLFVSLSEFVETYASMRVAKNLRLDPWFLFDYGEELKKENGIDGTTPDGPMRLSSITPLQLYSAIDTGSTNSFVAELQSSALFTDQEEAEWLACGETWRPYPNRRPISEHEPYSSGWFDDIERRRYSRHGKWIPKHFEFNRHRGERVLGLGDSLGTDWVQFALGGARVHHCSPSWKMLSHVRSHFDIRGVNGTFVQGPLTALPYASDSMDVVCMTGMLTPIPATAATIDEIFRVLRPGGKLLAALPARYDSQFWKTFWLPWRRLFADAPEDHTRFSGRQVKRMFDSFGDTRIVKRHLRRSDIPHTWRWMLLPLLERVMGRFLVVKTFKPVGTATVLQAAA